MATPAHRIDRDLVNLDSGLFTELPQPAISIDALRVEVDGPAASSARAAALVLVPDVDDFARTQEMPRVALDSIAPVAMTGEAIAAPPATSKRTATWALGAAVALGLGFIAGLSMSSPKAAPAAAAAPPPAVVEAPAPVRAAAPPPVVEAPAKPADAAPAPVKSAPAKVAKAAVAKASVARAAEAPAPAPEPASTADLPMEMPVIPPLPKAAEVPFKPSSAAVAIADAGLRGQSCKDVEGSMSIPVSVTFAPSGRATRAMINGGPLRGTAAGSCLAQALRGAAVPPFDGEPVTVNTSVHLR